jgi:hypothetical protein
VGDGAGGLLFSSDRLILMSSPHLLLLLLLLLLLEVLLLCSVDPAAVLVTAPLGPPLMSSPHSFFSASRGALGIFVS